MVTKLDRLARSVVDLAGIVQKLEIKKVDLVVLDQGIDTTTMYGRLQFNILAAIDEFEREMIKERKTGEQRNHHIRNHDRDIYPDTGGFQSLFSNTKAARSARTDRAAFSFAAEGRTDFISSTPGAPDSGSRRR